MNINTVSTAKIKKSPWTSGQNAVFYFWAGFMCGLVNISDILMFLKKKKSNSNHYNITIEFRMEKISFS